MPSNLPFGSRTLVIPFTFVPSGPRRQTSGPATGMSWMEPVSFRYGVEPPDETAGPNRSYAPTPKQRSGGRSNGRNRGLLEELRDPMAELRSTQYYGLMRRLREIEPDNRQLQGINGPDFVPSQPIIDELLQELTAAQQRAAARARPAAEAETDDPATPTQRANLRRNMIEAGLLRPGDPREGHHIVPGGGPMSGQRDATPTQDRLSRLGIGLDASENGAPLSPGFHRLHTRGYYDYVHRRLLGETNTERARVILDQIRSDLMRYDELYQRTGELPPWR